jgi:hypothetical protein
MSDRWHEKICSNSDNLYPVAFLKTDVQPLLAYLEPLPFFPAYTPFIPHVTEQLLTSYGTKAGSVLKNWYTFLESIDLTTFFKENQIRLQTLPYDDDQVSLPVVPSSLTLLFELAATIFVRHREQGWSSIQKLPPPYDNGDFFTFLYEQLVDAFCHHFLDQGVGLILSSLLRKMMGPHLPLNSSSGHNIDSEWYVAAKLSAQECSTFLLEKMTSSPRKPTEILTYLFDSHLFSIVF